MARATSEGTIWWDRSRQQWRAQVHARGRRHTYTLKATTRSAAQRELRSLLEQRDDKTLPTGGQITLGAWVMDWVEHTDLRETVRDRYRDSLRHHVKETWLGRIRLTDLEPEDLERYVDEMIAGEHSTRIERIPTGKLNRKGNPVYEKKLVPRPLSPNTARGLMRTISPALEEAIRRRRIARNPVKTMYLPRSIKKPLDTASETDTRMLLQQALTEPHTAARWWLGLVFGLRPAEVLGLTVDRIHNDHIEVRQQLQQIRGRGQVIVPMAKTEAGNRDIPVPDNISRMLQDAIAWKRHTRLENDEHWTDFTQDGEPIDLVFVQDNGLPITQAVDTRRWDALLSACGMPHRRRYSARHTAASIMISLGMDIAVVSSILGHRKTSFTLDTYVHPLEEERARAAEKLGEYWGRR